MTALMEARCLNETCHDGHREEACEETMRDVSLYNVGCDKSGNKLPAVPGYSGRSGLWKNRISPFVFTGVNCFVRAHAEHSSTWLGY